MPTELYNCAVWELSVLPMCSAGNASKPALVVQQLCLRCIGPPDLLSFCLVRANGGFK